jgi:hypothetical protein
MRTGTTTIKNGSGADAEQARRLQRLGRELRLTDQILTDDLNAVEIWMSGGPAPAWTTGDGETVGFAVDQMPDFDTAHGLAVWLGTNAHEVGHVLYTPRTEDALIVQLRAVTGRSLLRMHNVVEDQRQERLLIGRFAPWRTYLVAALAHHIPVDAEGAWLLLAGRTWLAAEARTMARSAFAAAHGEAAADHVAALVGAYQRLDDPGVDDAAEAFAIIDELDRLYGQQVPEHAPNCSVSGGEGSPADAASPGLPAAADEESDEDADDDESDEGATGADDTDDADGDDRGEGGSDTDAGNAGDDGSDRAEATSTAGEGAGNQSVAAALGQQVADELAGDTDVQADLDQVRQAIDTAGGSGETVGATAVGEWGDATTSAMLLEREVSEHLLDIKAETESGWTRRTESGRFNARRWATQPVLDPESVFDRYDPGALDAASFEIVLLLDVSGSMMGQTRQLSEAAWATQHAVDRLEATITVLTYDERHYVMSVAGDRPTDRMLNLAALGGTDPTTALREAWRILGESDARTRVVMTMTDGAWYGSNGQAFGMADAHAVIDAMADDGIVTVLANLGSQATSDHRCQIARRIHEPADIARLFGAIAGHVMATA